TLTYTPPAPGGLPADQYSLFVRGDQIHDTDDNLPLTQANQLIVGNPGLGSISVVNVPGDGTLQAATDFENSAGLVPTNAPTEVALADVTQDGLPDLILLSAGNNTIQIFSGTGPGTFSNVAFTLNLPAQSGATAMTVTDINGDALPDIAVADTSLNKVSVFFNGGSGIFGARVDLAAGRSPIAIVAADFNRDGATDIAVVSNVQFGIDTPAYNV